MSMETQKQENNITGNTPLERLQSVQGKKIAVQCPSKDFAHDLWKLADRLPPRTYDYVSRIYTGWEKIGENTAYVFNLPLCDGVARGNVIYWKEKGYEIVPAELIFFP